MKTIAKPKAKVIGKDGNVFNLISICSESLKRNKLGHLVKKMQEEVYNSQSYDHAICIMSKYCDLV